MRVLGRPEPRTAALLVFTCTSALLLASASEEAFGGQGSRPPSAPSLRLRARAHAASLGRVPEERTGLPPHTACLTPNEMRPHAYSRILTGRRPGVLVSVGTFRALERAAQAASTRAILLDHDPRVVDFNRSLVSSLRRTSRTTWLAKVTSRMASAPEESVPGALANLSPQYAASWELLRSDEKFAAVERLARRGRITPIQGSLFGDRTMRALARALGQKRQPVSVLDLSNALDAHYGVTPAQLARLARNLRAFTFTPDALVLVTTRDHLHARDNFSYYAIPVATFIETLETIVRTAPARPSPFVSNGFATFLREHPELRQDPPEGG